MSAGARLQEALVAALGGLGELAGIYDGPPPRAAYPYLVIDAGEEGDWGHKSGAGREVRVAMTLWDDAPARLYALADAVEAATAAASQPGGADVQGWQLVSMALVRRRVSRDVAGPWAIAIDWRARLLAD